MLLIVCLTTAAWAFGFGVQSQTVSHWLAAAGASNGAIGWNHAGYYLGLALASLGVPLLLRRVGIRCAALGMILAGLCQIVFPLLDNLTPWFVVRFVGGMAGALSVIPLESWISESSAPEKRGQSFACYGVAITLGGALGIWAGLSLYQPGDSLPFWLGGAVPIVGGLALAFFPPPAFEHRQGTGLIPWRAKLLGLGTAWYQGFLEGGMLAFLSLFLLSVGYDHDGAGTLMALTMVGVILFQVPVAWLADRLGRRTLLLCCYAVVLTGLALIPWRTGAVEIALILFAVGACSGAMYPLGLALMGEGLADSSLPRAYAWYLALECVGSQVGAAVMGLARDAWGDAAMFGVGLAAGIAVLTLSLGAHKAGMVPFQHEDARHAA